MTRGLLFSFLFHSLVIFLTMLTLPFMMREPIDLPPIVSVELIEIKDKTFIPYAPKARKIIEKVKDDKSVSSKLPMRVKWIVVGLLRNFSTPSRRAATDRFAYSAGLV